MDKLVSVIIPTYNRAKLIKNAVMSVLNQSYSCLELIVVDDCSTDNTLEVLAEISDERLVVYQNDINRGANYSRNYGISKSKGEYVAFHDSDDLWKKNKLEICINEFERRKCDIVFSGMMKYGKNYKRFLPVYNLNDYEDKYRQLLYQNCVSTQNLMGLKEVFIQVPFDENQKKMQDWDIIIRIAQNNYSIYYINLALTDAYMQEDSITKVQNGYESLKRIYLKHKEYIDQDEILKHRFMLNLGKNVMYNRKRSLYYFKQAMKIKKDMATIGCFFMELLGVMVLYEKGKNCMRSIFSKLGMWKLVRKV